MKSARRSIIVLLVLLMGLFSIPVWKGHAIETRASHYFSVTAAWATALGNGKILIEYDMASTDIMDELGVKTIEVEEKQPDGSYETVRTYNRYNTSGLIRTDNVCAGGSITYSGISGRKYYAIVTFYAKDSDGSEIMYHATNTVTA